VQVRIPAPEHRKLRGLARLYKAPLPVFVRDLYRTLFDVQAAQDFQLRLQRGMIAHRQKQLMLTASEGFTAPKSRPTPPPP
jgi:hypothetical protein